MSDTPTSANLWRAGRGSSPPALRSRRDREPTRAALAVGDGGFGGGAAHAAIRQRDSQDLTWTGFAGAELERLLAGGAVSPRVP
jgi:hypothetical protein